MAPIKLKQQPPTTPGKSIEEEETINHSPPTSAFQALFSDLKSPEGISQPVLNRCYSLLNDLSSFPPCIMRMGDIARVSDFLFKELSERFEKSFSSLSHVDSGTASDQWDSFGIEKLLLRCCLVFFTLPDIDQEYRFHKGQVILGILRQLRSFKCKLNQGIRFMSNISSTCEDVDAGHVACSTEGPSSYFLELSGTLLHFVSAMHEVILDEFLMRSQLRSFLMFIDSFDQPNGLQCRSHAHSGDVGILLEVIFCHFSLSISCNQDLKYFLEQLFCVETKKFRRSEISMNAATMLLHIPIILFAPEFMQAYITGLISKSFSDSLGSESLIPDCQLMRCLLPALEKSVVLYTKYRRNFLPDRSSEDVLSSSNGENLRSSFGSFILPDSGNEMNMLIANLDDCPESYVSNMTNKTRTDIVSTAICYIKECRVDIFDKYFQDEISSILTRVVTESSESLEYAAPDARIHSLCMLAAVLKLMSTVLLRTVSLLRYNGDPDHPKCRIDIHLCKDYDILESIIGCFGSSEVQLPVQHFLCNLMKTSSTKHEKSRMMFLHFSGLLSHALNTGFDFLIKGSLSVLMALMNLFVFEEGNLNIFYQLSASISKPAPSGLPSASTNEPCPKKKDETVVVLNFLRNRTLYLRSCKANYSEKYEHESSPNVGTAQNNDIMNSSVTVEAQTEEKCNGDLFLNLVLEPGKKIHDFDDLANFIECEPGKDYAKVIKNLSKFRKWKEGRKTTLRWKRKTEAWRTSASKITYGVLQRSKRTRRTAASKKTLGVLWRS